MEVCITVEHFRSLAVDFEQISAKLLVSIWRGDLSEVDLTLTAALRVARILNYQQFPVHLSKHVSGAEYSRNRNKMTTRSKVWNLVFFCVTSLTLTIQRCTWAEWVSEWVAVFTALQQQRSLAPGCGREITRCMLFKVILRTSTWPESIYFQ